MIYYLMNNCADVIGFSPGKDLHPGFMWILISYPKRYDWVHVNPKLASELLEEGFICKIKKLPVRDSKLK